MCVVVCFFVVFFFKQKTAYEMRISDWSSDVCFSDLQIDADQRLQFSASRYDAKQNTDYASDPLVAKFSPGSVPARAIRGLQLDEQNRVRNTLLNLDYQQIGRASCRERVCQYV